MRNPFDIFSPNSPLFREETVEERWRGAIVLFIPYYPLWRGEEVRPKPCYGNIPPEAE
jgi:hypothetical protein